MGTLVELARISKNEAVYGYAEPQKRPVPGTGLLMGAGAASAGAGGFLALKARNLPAKASAAAAEKKVQARRLNARAYQDPRFKNLAVRATRESKLARFTARNAPERQRWLRRTGGKLALAGGAAAATGYGLKRLGE